MSTDELRALAALAEAALAKCQHGPDAIGVGGQCIDCATLYMEARSAITLDGTLELIERVLKAEAIVRNLAVEFRRHDADQRQHGLPCRMCDGVQGDHREYCPGRRAVESQP